VCAAEASAEREPGWPADALEVGRVAGAWGVKGWIKVQPFSNDPQALLAARRWFVKPPEESASVARPGKSDAADASPLNIVDARRHGDFVVALAEGSNDRTSAEALRGARLFVSRSSFPASAKDEYYWADLIGLEVRTRDGTNLGTVVGLLETGPQSVLRVRLVGSDGAAGEDECLIPFVAAYIDDVDLENKRIAVDWRLDF
jgi:16S rRNA processing protein RimM